MIKTYLAIGMEEEFVSIQFLEEVDRLVEGATKRGREEKEAAEQHSKKQVFIGSQLSLMRQGRVAVAQYTAGKPFPVMEGFVNVAIFSSAKGFGSALSPFVLKNANNEIVENVWQFSKLYPKVTAQNTPQWKHPAETHVDESNKPTSAYWRWRAKGLQSPVAVRFPNGKGGRSSCIGSVFGQNNEFVLLGYVDARKKIYCPEMAAAALRTEAFKKIAAMLAEGKNVQLIEYDGPKSPTIVTEQVIRRELSNTKKPFGHCFVIAALLLNGNEWLK